MTWAAQGIFTKGRIKKIVSCKNNFGTVVQFKAMMRFLLAGDGSKSSVVYVTSNLCKQNLKTIVLAEGAYATWIRGTGGEWDHSPVGGWDELRL